MAPKCSLGASQCRREKRVPWECGSVLGISPHGDSPSLWCHVSVKPVLKVFPVVIGVEISTRFSHSPSGRDLLSPVSVSSLPSIPAGAQYSWRRAAALFAAGGIKQMGFQTLMDILICAFPIILFLKPLVSLSLSSLFQPVQASPSPMDWTVLGHWFPVETMRNLRHPGLGKSQFWSLLPVLFSERIQATSTRFGG